MQQDERRNSMNIKIGILGYGNIGRGVETALRDNPGYGTGSGLYKTGSFTGKDSF